jgi:predicted transcriptional regulator
VNERDDKAGGQAATFRTTAELARRVAEIAEREGNSKSAVIRRLISRGLAQEPAGGQA